MATVFWRNGIAWARVQHKGRTYRESLDTKDKRVARDRLTKFIERLKGTKWGDRPQRSFEEAAERFIDEHLPRLKGGVEGKASKRYLTSLIHLSEHFKGAMLDDIESGMLSEFEQKRRRAGRKSGTIRNDLWCLSSIMTSAEEWQWIVGNTVKTYIKQRAKRGVLAASPARVRYCSHDEEDELLRRCKASLGSRANRDETDHIMLRAGMILTIDIGLRKEELLAATWSMLDLERNQWNVPKDLVKASRKTGRGRSIPILQRSQELLRSLPRSDQIDSVLWHSHNGLHQRYFDLLPALQNIATGGRSQVFRREATKLAEKKLKVTDARRREIAEVQEREAWANVIPDLRWHDLRRTCGCRLLQDLRMSMEEVSKWLGHSSIQVTEKAYAFLEVEHLHEAVGRQIAGKEKHIPLIGRSQNPPESRTIEGTAKLVDERTTS